jgi:hypothetical protein
MARKTLKYATVAGKTFQGDTVADAKNKGADQVARMVYEADLGPSIYHVNGLTGVIFPTLYDGWTYTILNGKEAGVLNSNIVVMGGTRQQASRAVVSHMAQGTWSHDVVDDREFFAEAFFVIKIHSDAEASFIMTKVRESVSWAQWQRRWKAANEVIGDRNAAHDIASRTATIDEAIAMARRETAVV